MNPASSQNKPAPQHLKISAAAIVKLGLHSLAVFGLAVLFYRLLLNKMWLVPLLAEIVIAKSVWTIGPLWRGLIARSAGIVIGNALAYFLYIIPVIYKGNDPWSEEALWAYIVVGVQTVVAAIVLITTRVLTRKILASAS